MTDYVFKPHERPTLPGSPANPDHPTSRRLIYFAIGCLIGITGRRVGTMPDGGE